ncbi:hypothetical protein OESDEN_00644 [Oesophagostomum dentatum]|uniref:Peptidase S1 domain-containing protein n=1 Tax=Oesophagostomum dentatum TaxID=61180 RepID=A0A0B1TV75_OESDE|nr:hypothetical protein OESDEN_00644 [Oesophagostomum dentatum]
MWDFLAFLLVLHLATCMRDSEKTEWNRYGYLVKVLTETSDGTQVLGCTGTLITPSLVLTSSKCMENEDGNSVIIYAKGSRYRKRMAASVTISGDFAVLEIPPVKDEMCPSAPAPVRLSRLPVNVSLTSAPWENIKLNDVVERKCRITGFETTSGICIE